MIDRELRELELEATDAGDDPRGFMRMPEVIGLFESYAKTIDAPVIEETTVFSAWRTDSGYRLDTSNGIVDSRFLVAATGAAATPNIPGIAAALPGASEQVLFELAIAQQGVIRDDEVVEGAPVGEAGPQVSGIRRSARRAAGCPGGAPCRRNCYRPSNLAL